MIRVPRRVVSRSVLIVCSSVILAAGTVVASDVALLDAARYAGPIAVPQGGLSWKIDDATLELFEGRVWVAEPTGDGFTTGLVFEGRGHFSQPISDPVERRQFRRFAEQPTLLGIVQDFDSLFLRTSDFALMTQIAALAPEAPSYQVHRAAKERTREWALYHVHDPDGRVLAGLATPADRYVRADIRTADFGWLTYQYDAFAAEEIQVEKFREGKGFVESWLSLDRKRDRQEGRPASEETGLLELVHFDTEVDVRALGKGAMRGAGRVDPVKGVFRTTSRLRSKRAGLGAVSLDLSQFARVDSVRDTATGANLEFVRKHIGGLSNVVDKRVYDSSLVVFLPEPINAGQEVVLEVSYELELDQYAPLLSWYPRPRGMGLEYHTYSIQATHRKDFGFKATGTFVETRDVEGGRLSHWRAEEPIDAAAFTLALQPHEQSYEFDGLPEIVLFGTQRGDMSADKIESFSADVINSVNFFQNLFGTRVNADQLNVTFIASGHGQAGQGLIHVSDAIAFAGRVGVANEGVREAFLAHEVAHEWWGHQVRWKTYRDQWLSEGFAEYSSMMFLEATYENGAKLFRNMLEAHTNELTGSMAGAFGAFSRAGLARMNDAARERIGPIGHGRRAGTAEAPAAYASMAYSKGAMVLHMLRTTLRTVTKSDELFFEVLRDFVARYQGKAASTEDFQSILSEHAQSDWSWFFDQWVYSTHIPTYRYEDEVRRGADGQWILELTVEQTDVPEGFRAAVPVRAEFGGGKSGELLVMVDQPQETFELNLPEKPRKVIFNPDFAVLAKMKR